MAAALSLKCLQPFQLSITFHALGLSGAGGMAFYAWKSPIPHFISQKQTELGAHI